MQWRSFQWVYIWVLGSLGLFQYPSEAQSPSRLTVSLNTETVKSGEPFPIDIEMSSSTGSLVTTQSSLLRLRSFTPTQAPPVFSEIRTDREYLEIANPSNAEWDLGGWEIQLLSAAFGPTMLPVARLRFPSHSILPSGGVVTWTSEGVAPGVFPNLVHPSSFLNKAGYTLARLFDSQGHIMDELQLVSPSSNVRESPWKGSWLVLGIPSAGNSLHRRGYANHFRAEDWLPAPHSPKTLHSALVLPWTYPGEWRSPSPIVVQLTNGAWRGEITLPEGILGKTLLEAGDGLNVNGRSTPFEVVSAPPLKLEVPPELQQAHEALAGSNLLMRIWVEKAPKETLSITLSLSETNEFKVPSTVTIPAGSTEAWISISNLDDSEADGTALCRLTASASGYASATATLLNEDDERGELFIGVPSPLPENNGFAVEKGIIFLSSPSQHPVRVTLRADPPLEVPSEIIVPIGHLSQTFSIRVEGDAFVNPDGWTVQVHATTGEWPEAQGGIRIIDDEDSDFSISLPFGQVEGGTGVGLIQVKQPHASPTTFSLRSTSTRLRFPEQVILPSGALQIEFPVECRNNEFTDGQTTDSLCAETSGVVPRCGVTVLNDDEVNIRELKITAPKGAFSGEPFGIGLSLVDWNGIAQRTNGLGQLRFLCDTNLIQFPGLPDPIEITLGTWSNSVIALGEGLAIPISASAVGYENKKQFIDVLKGHQIPFLITDAAWHSGLQAILVSEPIASNTPARLTALDPKTGLRLRSLDLPSGVGRIAITEDAKTAWLASTQRTLLHVDLAQWSLDRVQPISEGAVADVLMVPGTGDSVILATRNGNESRAMLLRDGAIAPIQAILPAAPDFGGLCPGRDPGEFFCVSSRFISRLRTESDGIHVEQSKQLFVGVGSFPKLTLSAGTLFLQNGLTFSPDTLEKLGSFGFAFPTIGIPVPEIGRLFTIGSASLSQFDLMTRAYMGAHGVPPSGNAITRIIRWGSRGLAGWNNSGGNFFVLESPFLNEADPHIQRPDLSLHIDAPSRVVVSPSPESSTRFTLRYSVTNHSAFPAHGVWIDKIPFQFPFGLGSFAPGEGRTVEIAGVTKQPEILLVGGRVQCIVPDANIEDNEVSAIVHVVTEDLPWSKQLSLGMNHLIGAPAGDRLYAAVSRSAGDTEDGVAVIDPEKGVVERMLPVGAAPSRLAITGDGKRLLVKLGANTLLRWNLESDQAEFSLTLTNENILDFIPLPDNPRAAIVSTTSRLAVFDDQLQRPLDYIGDAIHRSLGFAGSTFWTWDLGELRPFTITSEGLKSGNRIPLAVDYVVWRFVSDGRFLHFASAIFDTQTLKTISPAEYIGEDLCVDTAKGSIYSALWGCVGKFSSSSHSSGGMHCLPMTAPVHLENPVRWGKDGLAVRSGKTQLLLFHSPLVPDPISGDLAVMITPGTNAPNKARVDWTVTVTNRSNVTVKRALLSTEWSGVVGMIPSGPSLIPYAGKAYAEILDIGSHETRIFTLNGKCTSADQHISAEILMSGTDLNPTNNSASVTLASPFQARVFAIHSISAPSQGVVGTPFNASFIITNTSPDAIVPALYLLESSGWDVLEVIEGGHKFGGYIGMNEELQPCESRNLILRMSARQAGFMPVSPFGPLGLGTDSLSEDPDLVCIRITRPLTNEVISTQFWPGALFAWDRSRQQVLATLTNSYPGLLVLDPNTLEAKLTIPLPSLVVHLAPCIDGRHVWVALSDGSAARIDLESKAINLRFPVSSTPGRIWAIACPPQKPDTLVACFDPGTLGNSRVQLFERGVARSQTYKPPGLDIDPLPEHVPLFSMTFTPDSRFFASTLSHLRELKLGPNGISELRSLDTLSDPDSATIGSLSNQLIYTTGTLIQLSSLTASKPFGSSPFVTGDWETSRFLATSNPEEVLPSAFVASYSASPASLQWRLSVSNYHRFGKTSTLLTMGTNGALVISDSLRLLKTSKLEPLSADLEVVVHAPPTIGMQGVVFPIQITVTNVSMLQALETKLIVDMPPELSFDADTSTSNTNRIQIALGTLVSSTNLTLLAKASRAGDFSIEAKVSSSMPDLRLENNLGKTTVTVLPPPRLFVDDMAVPEGSPNSPAIIKMMLSRPAPAPFSVTITNAFGTANQDDFPWSTYVLARFEAGAQLVSMSRFIIADLTPEADEAARLLLTSTNILLSRNSFNLTILNDDYPQVFVGDVSVDEGDSGQKNAQVQVSLSQKVPFPVEVQFATAGLSATADSDFIPRSGWLHFEPNEQTKLVLIPIIGDTLFEPAEKIAFSLLSASEAEIQIPQATITINNDDPLPPPSLNIRQMTDGRLLIEFQAHLGGTYQLESRTNLMGGSWSPEQSPIVGTGGPSSIIVTPKSPTSTYFQLRSQ